MSASSLNSPASGPLAREPRVLTVLALTQQIKQLLEPRFASVVVVGEASGVNYHSSGHCYFTLKDAAAQIPVTLWQSVVLKMRFRIQQGMKLRITGRVTVYAPHGKYQLSAEHVEPAGVGDLHLAFEQLKQKLYSEGLFDPARKRPLPFLATRIGLVTSPTGAALRDMITVIWRRFPHTTLVLAPARVQGEGAADEIVRGLERLNRYGKVDVIIAGRGGGSMEDLWCFNEEKVARAIVASRIPVVSAVGHEVDVTIADYVADKRAPTPSAAAELVTRPRAELLQGILEQRERLARAIRLTLQDHRSHLLALTERLKDPRTALKEQRQALESLRERLHAAISRGLGARRAQLEHYSESLRLVSPSRAILLRAQKVEQARTSISRLLTELLNRRRAELSRRAATLHALSPLAVLGRGYAIAYVAAERRVVRRPADAPVGERVAVQLLAGSLLCQVLASSDSWEGLPGDAGGKRHQEKPGEPLESGGAVEAI